MSVRSRLSAKPWDGRVVVEPPGENCCPPLGKPLGLWYQVDDDWEQWCGQEDWWPTKYKYKTLLALDLSKMLVIRTEQELQVFTKRFGLATARLRLWGGSLDIDWQKIYPRWSGIEIAPYQPSFRGESWYYGWDCASGCIWKQDAVVSFFTEPYKINKALCPEETDPAERP